MHEYHKVSDNLLLRFLLKNKTLNYPSFRNYLGMRSLLILALNMQTTIIGYWVYHLTNDVTALGKLGLSEAIPAILCSLITGHFVDKREKRNLLLACIGAYLLLAGYYLFLSREQFTAGYGVGLTENLIYLGMFTGGVLRAFLSPVSFSMLGLLVPKRLYPNATTWSSTAWQTGAVLGPLMGGVVLGLGGVTYGLATVIVLVSLALIAVIRIPRQPVLQKVAQAPLKSIAEGLRFIFKTQIILAALALDMFAVLFGGAVALLPVYAKDILHVGAEEFGMLRSAPGIGSIIMLFLLSVYPVLKKNPGKKLLWAIAGFGLCIILFGISTNFVLSLVLLTLSGMFDSVSVVIRSTILQLYTPDEMRGRVAAVNTMFISSSNEIGEVESGYMARAMGTVPSVVFGGCMTIGIVIATWFFAPKIRNLSLDAKAAHT